MKRVAVAMSGGVDSSVAALLLQEQGYQVLGFTMRLLAEADLSPRPCCLTQDVEDAQQVCRLLGLPHYVLNLQPQFETQVIEPCIQEYSRGRTPNPCVLCNQEIKFRLLLRKVLSLGVDYLATGHYARLLPANGDYALLKGKDPKKDQSYFLFTLGQEELRWLLFPLGDYSKEEVRRLARQQGLPVSDKEESQDVCFTPLLAQRLPSHPGEVVDKGGMVLGQHRGIAHYTVGQRRGLGLASPKPLYVVRIEPEANRVIVGEAKELYSHSLLATPVYWVPQPPPLPLTVSARVRYRSAEAEATLYPQRGGIGVHFSQPQRAIAPGQAVVFYGGEEVLGGGIIAKVGDE